MRTPPGIASMKWSKLFILALILGIGISLWGAYRHGYLDEGLVEQGQTLRKEPIGQYIMITTNWCPIIKVDISLPKRDFNYGAEDEDITYWVEINGRSMKIPSRQDMAKTGFSPVVKSDKVENFRFRLADESNKKEARIYYELKPK